MANLDTTPQTATTNALSALPFETLIGGPLKAAISAQALAAKTTWEFIKEVGLWDDPKTGEKKAVNVTFMFQKDGEMRLLVVPLLTIVPIPYIAVDEITIDFLANISASASSVEENVTSENLEGGGGGSVKVGWGPFNANVDFHANYSSKKDSKSSKESRYSVEYTMNVHVAASQKDMPTGLARVLNILEGAITEAKPGGSLQPTPKASQLAQRADQDATAQVRFILKNGHGELVPDQPVNIGVQKELADVVVKVVGPDGTPAEVGSVKTDPAGGVTVSVTVPRSTGVQDGSRVTLTASAAIANPPGGPDAKAPPPTAVSATATVTLVPKPKGLPSVTYLEMPRSLGLAPDEEKTITVTVTRDNKRLAGARVTAKLAANAAEVVDSSSLTSVETNDNGEAAFKIKATRITEVKSSTVVFSTEDGGVASMSVKVTPPLTLDVDPATVDLSAQATRTVKVRLKRGNDPAERTEVSVAVTSGDARDLDAGLLKAQPTNDKGEVEFTLKKVAAPVGSTANVSFSAGGASKLVAVTLKV